MLGIKQQGVFLSLVHLINICGENHHLRQARNRYLMAAVPFGFDAGLNSKSVNVCFRLK